MYKFITYEEWEDSYKESHPDARCNPEKTEVVLTINACNHEDTDSCIDHEAALAVVSNWTIEEDIPTT